MPNLERLDEVMEYIEQNPDEHDQNMWGIRTPCGTRRCFAGTAMYLFRPNAIVWFGQAYDRQVMDVKHSELGGGFMAQAMEILDLNYNQADALFYGAFRIETLRNMVTELHENPNSDLTELREDDEEL